MFEKLKANLDAGAFLVGVALIVIAAKLTSLSKEQKVLMLSLALMTEMWLMRRVVSAEVSQSRRYPLPMWRKLAPGTFPFLAGVTALVFMLKAFHG